MKDSLYKGFKKVAEDDKSATLAHENGHKLQIAKSGLSSEHKRALSALPLCQADPEVPVGNDEPNMTSADTGEPMIGDTAPSQATQSSFQQPQSTQQIQPTQQPETPMSILDEQTKAMGNIGEANRAGAEKQSALQGAQATLEGAELSNEQEELEIQQKEAETAAIAEDSFAGHITPQHVYGDSNGWGIARKAIGLILGGIGAGALGQQNPILQQVQKQIEMDFEKQKLQLGAKHNLTSALQNKYKDSLVAKNMYHASRLAIFANELAKAAQETNSKTAIPNAQMAILSIKQQMAPLLLAANNQDMLNRAQQGVGNQDPASFIRYMNAPEDAKKEMFKEIGDAQNISKNSEEMLKNFDQASEDVRLATGGHPMYAMGVKPPSVKGLMLLADPLLHDKEGRPNEQARKDFEEGMPQRWDSDETIAKKRDDFVSWLHNKSSAPTSKGYGLDLSKFWSTSPSAKAAPVERLTKDGKVAVFDPNTKEFLRYK